MHLVLQFSIEQVSTGESAVHVLFALPAGGFCGHNPVYRRAEAEVRGATALCLKSSEFG